MPLDGLSKGHILFKAGIASRLECFRSHYTCSVASACLRSTMTLPREIT